MSARRFLLAGWAVLLLGATPPPTAPDPALGEPHTVSCAGCHGPEGRSDNPLWPRLAGQHQSYLLKQLEDFRTGTRTDLAMAPMAATLPAERLADIAAYFATRSPAPVRSALYPDLGRTLYTKGRPADGVAPCVGCHGSRGQGYPGVFPGGIPAVGGQPAPYIVKQLIDFRTGARSNDSLGVMRAIAAKLTEDEITALGAYVEALR